MPSARINGFDMFFVDAGNAGGEPVICTTGWGPMSNRMNTALPDGLAERFRVVAYDHRGIGQSQGGLDREPSTRLYADDVVALMDHLGIDRAHIVGLGGMGGCIAQEVGINYAGRAHSLVLGHGWAKADAFLHHQFLTLQELRQIDFYKYQSCAAILCHKAEYFNEHVNEILGPTGGWCDLIEHPQAHLNFIKACIEHDTTDRLHVIKAPTLIVQGGEFDLMTGGRLGIPLQERIAGSELLVLDDAPHATRDVPAEWSRYSAKLMSFLAAHPLKTPAAV